MTRHSALRVEQLVLRVRVIGDLIPGGVLSFYEDFESSCEAFESLYEALTSGVDGP